MTEAQKAKRAAYNRAWQQENPERVQAALKRYREKHPEKVREWRRASYQRNREKTLAREREKRAKRIPPEVRRLDENYGWMKEARLALGLKQWHVARKVGCNPGTYSRVECGEVKLSHTKHCDAICKTLKGVSYRELLETTRQMDS